MTPKRKKRLTIILGLVFGTALIVGLVMFSLSENINLFYSTSQIANGEASVGTRIRAGGMVVDGSVKRSTDSLKVQFALTDYEQQVTVEFTGILPDLFREGQGIIAQGKMDANGIFQADEVLAKHDENYMPPEIAESMKKKQEAQK
ncbi:cytochrome c-type biogenesis protein CcmE [Bathymodiolus platifrons methanotrophic gill symbiont]|uniref:cytochrome c maturation protein CcmE n=1 Tax=Bathymodiolus platifrons methanotrophic gill symbiont TaxID=113268 RepID=UPI0011C71BF0|nr:cytochrome c maturation protein CcmE [Bathymodiolus platifrons methanotrophic gill symbiont]TXK99798.1 cytochrome c biogenesis protein CcmE [Methylococcaceae bacterium HT1]TXL18594.1 cytochrome c biogenesis protein CcmE [Methylococcaceae bacterium HT3]TXL23575.1 cytochrome c biogenesis protein CcmE [Methylococcaceae bacterium HT2]GFO74830.1 cytochrome c-type biogenesis protein CcmE [Bathymodiolus platifrons methanotrophic gill symbiont]